MQSFKSLRWILLPLLIIVAVMISATPATAESANLSDQAQTIMALAEADDEAALRDYLEGMAAEERIAAVSELAGALSSSQIRNQFPILFKSLTAIHPVNEEIPELIAAIKASQSHQAVISSAVKGIVLGTLTHPALNPEEVPTALAGTAETVAAAVVGFVEQHDLEVSADRQIDAANAAFAVSRGMMQGVETTANRPLTRQTAAAMAKGAVEAAREPNKPAVARAMMLALAQLKDVSIRRAAVAGLAEGGAVAGGPRAAEAMAPLQEQLAQAIPAAPLPVAPELPVPPVHPDEPSPF